ncbi:MAG: hypothetical protein Q9211_000581, partial [Gyalolechia sp. 1 TL-2023]
MAGRSLEKVNRAMAEIASGGIRGSLSAVHLDVTDEASIRQAAQHVHDKHGRLDALINNAAVGCVDPNIKTRMQLSMETNAIGPAVVADAFRPLLLQSDNPYSVYVSSSLGSLSMVTNAVPDGFPLFPNMDAYRMSKAALNMLMVVEAEEYAAQGMKVFAMCPGFVVSNLRGTNEAARSGAG